MFHVKHRRGSPSVSARNGVSPLVAPELDEDTALHQVLI